MSSYFNANSQMHFLTTSERISDNAGSDISLKTQSLIRDCVNKCCHAQSFNTDS